MEFRIPKRHMTFSSVKYLCPWLDDVRRDKTFRPTVMAGERKLMMMMNAYVGLCPKDVRNGRDPQLYYWPGASKCR